MGYIEITERKKRGRKKAEYEAKKFQVIAKKAARQAYKNYLI